MTFLKRWLPVVLWAGLILSFSNDSFSNDQTAGWLQRMFGRELPQAVNYVIRKAGHVIGYGILGALILRADRRPAVILGITALVAIADEIQQSTTMLRSGTPWDVLLDLAGAALAAFVIVPAVRARLSSPRSEAKRGATGP